jgi:hypothetical protein
MRWIGTTSHSIASDLDLHRVRVTALGWIRILNHSIGLDFAMDSSPDRIHAHHCWGLEGSHRLLRSLGAPSPPFPPSAFKVNVVHQTEALTASLEITTNNCGRK